MEEKKTVKEIIEEMRKELKESKPSEFEFFLPSLVKANPPEKKPKQAKRKAWQVKTAKKAKTKEKTAKKSKKKPIKTKQKGRKKAAKARPAGKKKTKKR